MSTTDKLAELRQSYVSGAADCFDHYMTWAESPIERLLLAQMLAEGWATDSNPSQSWLQVYDDVLGLGFGPHPRFIQSDTCACICLLQAHVRGAIRRPAFFGCRGGGPLRRERGIQ